MSKFLLGFFLGVALTVLLCDRPIRIHIESVGQPVETGIAKRREALRALGVDVK